MTKIISNPKEVWARMKEGKGSRISIAKDDDLDVEMFAEGDNIYVMQSGVAVCESRVWSAEECARIIGEDLEEYFYNYSDVDEDEAIEDAIIEREDELDQAIMDFLATVLGEGFYDLDGDSSGEIIEDCKEHFLEYIARKFSISIYRPMYLEDEDGTDFYTDTPYEEMVFDDEDNPIYK